MINVLDFLQTAGHTFDQARSQKSAMGGLLRGCGAEPPASGGNLGCGGEAPNRWRHWGLWAEPPAIENFVFF